MRVDQLLKAQRSVETILTKNANKHSTEFMEGMDLVRGVETDLIKSKEIIAWTKEFFKEMNQKIAISTMDILKIARKKKRMEIWRKILVDVYTRFYKWTTKIDELINVWEYFDALALIDKTLTELDTLPKDINLAAIQDIKRKLKGKRELISEKNSQGISDTISNFNQILYSKWLKTLKVKAGEKSDPRMAGRKQSSRTKILFEVTLVD